MELGAAAALCFLAGLLLLLHHGYEHAREDPATSLAQQESCKEVCYLQLSDVGNVRTCNHEMWIILLFSLALICLVYSYSIPERPAREQLARPRSTHGAQGALSPGLCSASRGWKLLMYCASTSGASSTLSV